MLLVSSSFLFLVVRPGAPRSVLAPIVAMPGALFVAFWFLRPVEPGATRGSWHCYYRSKDATKKQGRYERSKDNDRRDGGGLTVGQVAHSSSDVANLKRKCDATTQNGRLGRLVIPWFFSVEDFHFSLSLITLINL